jgi:hypothetical protein
MKRILFTPPLVKLLVAATIVLGFVLLVWLMSGLPAPREQDRVAPINAGFSIIKPRDWEDRISYGPIDKQYATTILIEPVKTVGRGQRIFVGRFREPPDLEKLKSQGLAPGQFQGQEALLYSGQRKNEFTWRAVFRRGGTWYELGLRLPREEVVPRSEWWPYLTSFRPAEPTTAPTVLPATRWVD